MALRVGVVSTAHMHCWGYAGGLKARTDASLTYVWDDVPARGQEFANAHGATFVSTLDELLASVDCVMITSENNAHIAHLEAAHAAGKPALCEKPIVATEEHAARLQALVESGARIMTAFPCRYSPAFKRLNARVKAGDIGAIQAVCATNRGRSPFSWFVEKDKSGGGAMIDHVVHVADLLAVLLGETPSRVQAQIGNNMYGKEWDDTAMLTLEYPSGVFATLDSSWSRPTSYKTWGDVTMNVVGENGVIEIDLFGQAFDHYANANGKHGLAGYGSDIDAGLVDDFIRFAKGEIEAQVTAMDGLAAVRVALAGYRSAAEIAVISV